MASRILSIPGKTFFAGEYLALEGGPALVVGTKPRFCLEVRAGEGRNPFHPQSPAGQFYQTHQKFFSQFKIEFYDPYHGVGGFGASSAQFASLHGLYQLQDSVWTEAERFFDWHELLKDYRNQPVSKGYLPSGADIVGQCCGGMTYFDRNNGKVQTFAWPFSEYGFFLASTGFKVPTHEHLQIVSEIPFEEMDKSLKMVRQGIAEVDFAIFKQGLLDFKQTLIQKKWVVDATLGFMRQIESFAGVEFVKGCGALGADVILVIYRKEEENSEVLKKQLESLGLVIRADESRLDSGLKVEGIYAKI